MREQLQCMNASECFTQKKLLIFTSYLMLTNASPRKLNHSQTEQVTAAPSQHHPHLVTCSEHFYFDQQCCCFRPRSLEQIRGLLQKKKET